MPFSLQNQDLEAARSTPQESQPLLHNVTNYECYGADRIRSTDIEDMGDGKSDNSCEEGSSDDEGAEERLMKRVTDSGGLLAYLAGFSIFLPHLWPRKSPRIQLYLFLLGLCILGQRILNVLVPRQEGIVVDKLVQAYQTGELPWTELGIWFVLRFISSPGIRGSIVDLLELHIDNWSRRQMTDLVFSHIMRLSMDFHVNADSGELMKAIEQGTSLIKLIRLLLFDSAPIILDLIVAFFYVTSLFDLSFAGIMAVVAALYAFFTWQGSISEARRRREYAGSDRKVSKVQYESISNWTTVSYFNRQQHQHSRLMGSVEEEIAARTRLKNMRYLIEAGQLLSLELGRTCANVLAAYRVAQGTRPIGNFVALNAYWGVFADPLWVLSYLSEDITSYLVDAERVLQVLQRKPTITDLPDARPLQVPCGQVRFEDVSFSYNNKADTIKGVSFVAEEGQYVAFVGGSGSGKSTISKLLLRFYDVTSGSIAIDGNDIRNVSVGSLRESIGIVPQEAPLFNDSIMENVRYARLDASGEEVVEACRQACIHDKIMSFTNQYHTRVGERGVKLSGGERQRLSIARVVLKQPKILFLDEATSAVDSKTEADIQSALRRLSVGRTTFVIAHRLSTIMDADVIHVVENGRIVESGTHQGLLDKERRYRELWDIQTSKT